MNKHKYFSIVILSGCLVMGAVNYASAGVNPRPTQAEISQKMMGMMKEIVSTVLNLNQKPSASQKKRMRILLKDLDVLMKKNAALVRASKQVK